MIVMAVDDERFALENLVEAIGRASSDARIHRFRYPEDALDFAKENHVDVAFLDVEMIGMNGVELAERLKLYHPDINIIFSTGYGHYRDAAFDLHASGYLTKPITPEKVKKERKSYEEQQSDQCSPGPGGNGQVQDAGCSGSRRQPDQRL